MKSTSQSNSPRPREHLTGKLPGASAATTSSPPLRARAVLEGAPLRAVFIHRGNPSPRPRDPR